LRSLALSNGLRPGLGMLAKTLADELGPTGTRVNGLLPAYIATDRAKELGASSTPANSLRRQGTPLEVGQTGHLPAFPGRQLHHRDDDRHRRRRHSRAPTRVPSEQFTCVILHRFNVSRSLTLIV
jgi:NAD(P)-dependent dehydrogenase (short-subunit alcohol dehydrogenase family)